MAKPTEPEVTIELDRPRVMRMDLNAIAEIEDALGVNLLEEGLDLSQVTIKQMRQVVWAFLTSDDPELTPQDVGRLIHPGVMAELVEKLNELQERAVGKEIDQDKPKPKAKPRKAKTKAGTGT